MASSGCVRSCLDKKLWPAAAAEQEKRRTKDPWEDILNNIPTHVIEGSYGHGFESLYLKQDDEVLNEAIQIRYLSKDRSHEEVGSADLLKCVLNIPAQHQNSPHNTRLVTVMKRSGWEVGRVYLGKARQHGRDVRVRGYSRPITAAAAKDYDWKYDEPVKKVVKKVVKLTEVEAEAKHKTKVGPGRRF